MNYMGRDLTPVQVIEKINTCVQALTQGNINLKTLSIQKAQAEQSYRVALAKEMLKLKAEKYPATLIQDIVRGNEEVARLRLDRDIAESAYYTAISAMDNLKLEIETLRSQLTWLRAEYKNS